MSSSSWIRLRFERPFFVIRDERAGIGDDGDMVGTMSALLHPLQRLVVISAMAVLSLSIKYCNY